MVYEGKTASRAGNRIIIVDGFKGNGYTAIAWKTGKYQITAAGGWLVRLGVKRRIIT